MINKRTCIICIMLAISLVFAKAQQSENNLQQLEGERLKLLKEAQKNTATREEVERMIEKSVSQKVAQMTELLSLTSDQATKIYAIEVELNKIRSEKTGKAIGNRDAQIEINQEMITLSEEKYKPVLTADQFSKFQEYNRPVLRFLNRFNND